MTLEEAEKRIAALEAKLLILTEGLKDHQHELEIREPSSCGCCPGSITTHKTGEPIYLPEEL